MILPLFVLAVVLWSVPRLNAIDNSQPPSLKFESFPGIDQINWNDVSITADRIVFGNIETYQFTEGPIYTVFTKDTTTSLAVDNANFFAVAQNNFGNAVALVNSWVPASQTKEDGIYYSDGISDGKSFHQVNAFQQCYEDVALAKFAPVGIVVSSAVDGDDKSCDGNVYDLTFADGKVKITAVNLGDDGFRVQHWAGAAISDDGFIKYAVFQQRGKAWYDAMYSTRSGIVYFSQGRWYSVQFIVGVSTQDFENMNVQSVASDSTGRHAFLAIRSCGQSGNLVSKGFLAVSSTYGSVWRKITDPVVAAETFTAVVCNADCSLVVAVHERAFTWVAISTKGGSTGSWSTYQTLVDISHFGIHKLAVNPEGTMLVATTRPSFDKDNPAQRPATLRIPVELRGTESPELNSFVFCYWVAYYWNVNATVDLCLKLATVGAFIWLFFYARRKVEESAKRHRATRAGIQAANLGINAVAANAAAVAAQLLQNTNVAANHHNTVSHPLRYLVTRQDTSGKKAPYTSFVTDVKKLWEKDIHCRDLQSAQERSPSLLTGSRRRWMC